MKIVVLLETIRCCWMMIHCFEVSLFSPKWTKEYSTLAEATGEVIVRSFSQLGSSPYMIFPEITRSNNVKDFKDELLSKTSLQGNLVYRLLNSRNLQVVSERRQRSCIIITDIYEGLLEIFQEIKPHISKFNGIYLIVLTNGKIAQLSAIFILFWDNQIYNVNVMFATVNNSITIKSFNPFIHEKCNFPTPITINEFQNGLFLKPVKENFYPAKMQNLHKCTINVSVVDKNEPFVIIKSKKNSTKFEFSGRDINLMNSLAEQLNFKINYMFVAQDKNSSKNESVDRLLKALLDSGAQLSISDWFLKANRLTVFDASTVYIRQSLVFVIPRGRQFSPFEKIIYPFKIDLWIMVGICFSIGFLFIFVIKRMSKRCQKVVFGDGVNYPYLNMITGFLGGSQNILPKKDFARFILMLFLLCSLVVRTVYQGSFYELVQHNKNHRKVRSIDEMIQNDFRFYINPGVADLFDDNKALKKK